VTAQSYIRAASASAINPRLKLGQQLHAQKQLRLRTWTCVMGENGYQCLSEGL